ncbi:hypothetical protein B0H17DRAFT_1158522 [Mycena rosella]|uniref:T6SS Phospholipase effector Tle1-like catalytic domain-containing protein n=1 Tax=Mycena rosella TaxID=1033263 RepID=A0AAD7DR53_MYCRO|nr:hypothetical protein B0H17DRAFT_1158522 [Mycena rosella]
MCEKAPFKSKSRNLVVSIDGTSNQFGRNVRLRRDLYPSLVLTFYLSGIGTYVPPHRRHSFASWKQFVANKLDLAIAWNFKRHVLDSYRWLADHFQSGDVIFLFGFSRGAYQVRALAGMIATVGYSILADRIRKTSKIHFKDTFSRPVSVHFLGAWDTVSSVGIFRRQPLPLTTSADHICHFRHALAIDERRVRFLPEYVNQAGNPQRETSNDAAGTVKEVWFAGTHSDIDNIALDLAGVPLLWMENEATSAGLYLKSRPASWNWKSLEKDKPIESLAGFWWFLERIPLTRSTYNAKNLKETTR